MGRTTEDSNLKAQVVSVVQEKLKGRYDGYKLTYQPEPYQGKAKPESSKFIFMNSDLSGVVGSLTAGQWVELKFVKNDRGYYDLEDVSPTTEGTYSAPAAPQPGQAMSIGNPSNKDAVITRAVAFKASTEIVVGLMNRENSPIKKTATKEFIAEQVMELTPQFEDFLSFKEGKEEESAEVPAEDFNQEPF